MTKVELDRRLHNVMKRPPNSEGGYGGAMWVYDNQNECEVLAGCVKDAFPELFWQPSPISFPGVRHWFAEFLLSVDGEETLFHLAVMCGWLENTQLYGVMIRQASVKDVLGHCLAGENG